MSMILEEIYNKLKDIKGTDQIVALNLAISLNIAQEIEQNLIESNSKASN
ncbi:hypothetical protein [Paraclostridium bifermentans]|nr:hypothetical protein [Paraclostridium bifermentans]